MIFRAYCERNLFCRSTRSRCLDDVPVNAIKDPGNFYDHLPGTIVNGDDQCKLIEGEKHYQCPQRKVTNLNGSLFEEHICSHTKFIAS